MKIVRSAHDCVLVEESGIKVIYAAGGMSNDLSNSYPENSIESIKLTSDNFAQLEWKLESTELGMGLWHMGLYGLRLVKSNDRNILFYVVGGYSQYHCHCSTYYCSSYHCGGSQKTIWGFTKSKTLKRIGSLKVGIYYHQTLNIPLSSLKGCP